MADASLDFEFKGHFKGHSGKQRLCCNLPRGTLQFAPTPSRSQNTPLQKTHFKSYVMVYVTCITIHIHISHLSTIKQKKH